MIQVIASMIHKNQSSLIRKSYYVYFVPIRNYICLEKMEKYGIRDVVEVKNFDFGFIPLN